MVTAYLPLAYNIVGLALNGHPDAGVVREIMISAAADPRDEAAFRSRLLAACVSQVRRAGQTVGRRARPAFQPDGLPEPDFVQFMVNRLGLTGEQGEIIEASRWLGGEDRLLLALWWQEVTGSLHQAELADALRLTPAAAAGAVARLARELEISRIVERTMRRGPSCPGLMAAATGWDGKPAPGWRDRLAAHVLECPVCQPRLDDLPAAEWLLSDLPLVTPPPGLIPQAPHSAQRDSYHDAASAGSGPWPGASRRPQAGGAKARPRRLPSRSTLAVISAALALCLVGGVVTALRGTRPSAGTPGPITGDGKSQSAPASATFSLAEQKGVCVAAGDGVNMALAASGTAWYYNWKPTPSGIATPPGTAFVPMIHDASDVTPTVLNEVKKEGHYLLGFNEPDHTDGANMTVNQALGLWPKLEATGMLLGSPSVSWGTNSKTGWFGQFMAGAQARGYRVDFVTVHWYGQHNWGNTAWNVNYLKSYLTQTYALWGKPIWLTEFSLINFVNGRHFPTEAQQAAFLTAATKMLSTLHFVHRYAWYALSASGNAKGSTPLFTQTAAVTTVGAAFEEAP
jgi:hypothetical protein